MKSFIAILTLLIFVTSCAPPQTNTQKGAIYGTAAGAAVGAIVGQAIGHDTKGTLEGAAIGAAIGGLTGSGVGYYMDKQEQELRQALANSREASIRREGNILQVTMLGDFLFDLNSAQLHPAAYEDLKRIARVLKEYPQTKIKVEGFTDSTGTESYNLWLSQRRADTVKNALINLGVSPSRIIAIGYGEARPRASNATPTGRQLNRRVEIYIIPTGSG